MDPSHAIGSLLGTAVGDAIGLPYENLSPRRAARLRLDGARIFEGETLLVAIGRHRSPPVAPVAGRRGTSVA